MIKRRAHHIAFVGTFPQHVFHSHAPFLPSILVSPDVCTHSHTNVSLALFPVPLSLSSSLSVYSAFAKGQNECAIV